jgi:transposase
MQSTGAYWIALDDILSEVGSDMSRFSTEAHFISYLNLSPSEQQDQWWQGSVPGET